ncbi:hypothetical protein EMA8858_03879 [Emticicia aquatica]|uniref:Uncharacterized protein n=1 Tax=Emticicia aquatica TaxID=1681835 RepID=A0ABM9AW01_9BACT|nr:hypothetical protein EMA8858_03879 [Emticicia aquatica]
MGALCYFIIDYKLVSFVYLFSQKNIIFFRTYITKIIICFFGDNTNKPKN